MKYKIIQLTSYGSKSLVSWKKLTKKNANKLLTDLELLNPDDIYKIVKEN